LDAVRDRYGGAGHEDPERGEQRPHVGFPAVTQRVGGVGRAAGPPVGDQQEDLVARVGPRVRRLSHQRRRSGHQGGGRLRHGDQDVGAESHQHRREALRRVGGPPQQRHRREQVTGSAGSPLGRRRCRCLLPALLARHHPLITQPDGTERAGCHAPPSAAGPPGEGRPSGRRATSDTGPRWASLSGLTTACIVWTTSEPCPFGPMSSSITLTTRPSASYSTAPGWPLTQASRREAPRALARRSRLTSMRETGCRPASGFPIACVLPPPSACSTTSGASMPSSASMSPPAAASKNRRASSSPSARRAGDGTASLTGAPAAMRCRARAKICRQFTSVLPVILAMSGYPYPNTSRSMNTARSTGERASSSTRNAIDSESASSACSAGPGRPAGTTTGSGSQSPTYVSRRTRAEVRWLI